MTTIQWLAMFVAFVTVYGIAYWRGRYHESIDQRRAVGIPGKDWIQTYGGRKFFPLRPDPSQLDIRDVARALSMFCRYVGHVARFYSVAEHSVWISLLAEQRAREAGMPEDQVLHMARWGLMHDATEAYLGDVSAPLKRSAVMTAYRTAEANLQRVIAEWVGLTGSEPALVRSLDQEILGTEARQLKAPLHRDWTALAPELPDIELGAPPDVAELAFLRRFDALFFGRNANAPTGEGLGRLSTEMSRLQSA